MKRGFVPAPLVATHLDAQCAASCMAAAAVGAYIVGVAGTAGLVPAELDCTDYSLAD